MRTFGYIATGVIVGSGLMMVTSAIAGGFSIREQSTTGLGLAFADSAAGSDLSSMYWNPAAVTTQDGMNSLSSFTAIMPNTDLDAKTGSAFGTADTDLGALGLLSGSYYNYQINQDLYVGLSINAPFGLVTEADNKNWGGATYNRKSEILTINAAPTIGYKILPNLSVAVGVQIEYMKARLASANPLSAPDDIIIKGDDVAFGYTAGLLYEPISGTKIGVGYRSTIKHKLDGKQLGHPNPASNGEVTANFSTPEIVTASIRQEITPDLAVMANYEWTNWSRLKEFSVIKKSDGSVASSEDYFWKDSWFVSAGAELKLSDAITGRMGVGYEKSPVPDATRSARLPDSDRTWLSFGGSYKWSEATTLDFGYSHIFFKDSSIALTSATKGNLFADVSNSVDIISIGMRTKW